MICIYDTDVSKSIMQILLIINKNKNVKRSQVFSFLCKLQFYRRILTWLDDSTTEPEATQTVSRTVTVHCRAGVIFRGAESEVTPTWNYLFNLVFQVVLSENYLHISKGKIFPPKCSNFQFNASENLRQITSHETNRNADLRTGLALPCKVYQYLCCAVINQNKI